jgi:hypothetical protein
LPRVSYHRVMDHTILTLRIPSINLSSVVPWCRNIPTRQDRESDMPSRTVCMVQNPHHELECIYTMSIPFSQNDRILLEIIYIILPAMFCLQLVQRRPSDQLDFDLGIWIWLAWAENEIDYLASKPAVLQVNFRHWTSSPSSDIVFNANWWWIELVMDRETMEWAECGFTRSIIRRWIISTR